MLNKNEIRVIKFIVGDLTDPIAITNGKSSYSKIDLIWGIDGIEYPEAITYANAFCVFVSDMRVKFCRENAYNLVHQESILKNIADIVSEAVDKNFLKA